jgi:hypothetical protein
VIEQVAGVLLAPADAKYVLDAFESLLTDRRPSAQLADFIARLRKTAEASCVSARETAAGVRKLGAQHDPSHYAPCDVLDTNQAAAILGISASGVRDLGSRGVLPRQRAGGRWLYPAPAVVRRAERRAARKAS